MRATALPIALAATLLSLGGWLSLPKETRWRTADEGSFTPRRSKLVPQEEGASDRFALWRVSLTIDASEFR